MRDDEIITAIEAEESVLGACMWSLPVAREVVQMLEPGDFYYSQNRMIFDTIADLVVNDKSTDVKSVIVELRQNGLLDAVGGIAYVTLLLGDCPNEGAFKHYCNAILDAYARRSITDIGPRLTEIAHGDEVMEALDEAGDELHSVGKRLEQGGPSHISEGIYESFDRMMAAREAGSAITGLATGFTELDDVTSGLQPGNLIVVGGRTSMGKTSFVLNIAHYAALRGNPVLIFSLEMNHSEVSERLICQEAQVDTRLYRSGRLGKNEMLRVETARTKIANAPITIDDRGDVGLEQMRVISRQQKPSLIIVDYIQLMYGGRKDESRAQEVSRIARELKVMAMQLHIPVLAVSQLRRPGIHLARKEPSLEDLKESGGIEQNADLVILLYRPEVDEGQNADNAEHANVNLAKHRNGPTEKMSLKWKGEYCTFRNYGGNNE